MKLVLLALALALAACPHPVAAPPAPAATVDPALAGTIDALATAELARSGGPGLAVAVRWRDGATYARGFGEADVEHHVAVDPETVFRVGSITKQVTAAAVLRLVAAGRLGLDDALTAHLPDYPVHGRAITLRHLLTHTSGIADFEHAPWFVAHMEEARPVAELIASFAAAPFDFEPGTAWSYSNSGYVLLDQIVTRVTGRSFAAEVESMLAASGVAGIRYCPDQQDYPHAARGYQRGADGVTAARPIRMAYAGGAGALCATAAGLVGWAEALAHGRVVDARGWAAMTTPVTLADGSTYPYGLGLFTGTLGSHRMIFHSGGINGFAAKLAYYPDDELAIAVLVNDESSAADHLAEAIARAVLAVPATTAPVADLPIPAAELAAAVGRYRIASAGLILVVEADDGHLYARPDASPDRTRFLLQADGSYLAEGHPEVMLRFVRTGGTVTGLELHQADMIVPGIRLP